ncbi:MAG: hypothetical protein LBV18_04225 [Alistipes sp.]|jgi:hypothetical protein|nr:hypothetical protein [Alistipes sp.]
MKSLKILGYIDPIKAERLRNKQDRRATRHVALQNFAARHGYRFWNRAFNLFAL